jgi:hypothetical protein
MAWHPYVRIEDQRWVVWLQNGNEDRMLDLLNPKNRPHQHRIGVWLRCRCITFEKRNVIGAATKSRRSYAEVRIGW